MMQNNTVQSPEYNLIPSARTSYSSLFSIFLGTVQATSELTVSHGKDRVNISNLSSQTHIYSIYALPSKNLIIRLLDRLVEGVPDLE